MSAMALIALIAFVPMACSDDNDAPRQTVSIEAVASSLNYEEVAEAEHEARANDVGYFTRSWPPAGYYLYNSINNLFSNQRDLTDNSIYLFLTKGETTVSTKGRLSYRSDNTWQFFSNADDDLTTGDYRAFGFIPSDAASSSEISPFGGNFANGAILTIHGLHPVTASDVSVVIGASNYDGDLNSNVGDPSDLVRPGKFGVTLTVSGNNEDNNFVFLLFDHLYSALRFCINVDEKYDALRTIVLKKMELRAEDAKASYDATITLEANTTGEIPISSVVFTSSGFDADFETIFSATGSYSAGLPLSPSPVTLMGSFIPGDYQKFTLRTTYDVFDKKNNLVRKACTAENYLDVQAIISKPQILQRGKYYSINLTVMPTYLYVLSDPDLDNPTVDVGH